MCSLTLGIMEAGDRAAKVYTCRSSSARLGSLQGRWVTPDNCHVSRKNCILPLPAKSGSGRVGECIYWGIVPTSMEDLYVTTTRRAQWQSLSATSTSDTRGRNSYGICVARGFIGHFGRVAKASAC